MEAVRGLGRTGAPWRDLPPHLGQWHRVYVRFARWRDKGVWEQITTLLISNKCQIPHSRQRQVQVNSTSIRVHQHGTWAGWENGEQGVGRSRGGNTSKIHLMGDGAGNGLGWQVTAGQAGDTPEAAALLAPRQPRAQEVMGFSLQRGERLR